MYPTYVKPLAFLPNRDGFEFLGITADGRKIPCVTEKGPDGCYRVTGADFSDLVGWCSAPIGGAK